MQGHNERASFFTSVFFKLQRTFLHTFDIIHTDQNPIISERHILAERTHQFH
jgi:hypothetical protein